jgi:hypothetical protein
MRSTAVAADETDKSAIVLNMRGRSQVESDFELLPYCNVSVWNSKKQFYNFGSDITCGAS